jgi:HK97 family phage major capsid protein
MHGRVIALGIAPRPSETLAWLMATAGGNNVLTLGGGVGPSFAGYPVRISQVMLSDATADYNNKIMVFFGSLSSAAIFGDRPNSLSIVFDASRFVEFPALYCQVEQRWDIVAHDIGTSSTAGPLCGLKGTT